jgi:ectoine hydroxylase-related dioxygenase (phytanoyl-CoA dioxygenase family)
LLDEPAVAEAARLIRAELTALGKLPPSAVAIQAIAFDKTPGANWKVTWHQDLMLPFKSAVTNANYTLPSVKDGVDYARPPRAVLEATLAVRLHLDDCDETNGPLRISPGTHLAGVFPSVTISSAVSQHGEVSCLAKAGELILMRPLTLHASSPATTPKHRRVLHLVYHSGTEVAEAWHRSV